LPATKGKAGRKKELSYQEYTDSQAVSRSKQRAGERDLKIPDVKDYARREACKNDLEKFLREYMKQTFRKPFCSDHVKIIADFQTCVESDSDKALAADRGKGKTSLVKGALTWVLLYEHRRFPFWIGATGKDGKRNYKNLKAVFAKFEPLLEDFPEVCYPVRMLKGSSQRALTQTVGGELTGIVWGNEYLAFPVIEGLRDRSAYFASCGIDGAVRGMNCEDIRPDMVIFDDIETHESSKSIVMTDDRMDIINNDVGGLVEPGGSMTQILLGSIQAVDCIVDVLTDPVRSPSWQGDRYRFLNSEPDKMDLWDSYMEMRRNTISEGPSVANKFYLDNRESMDSGSEVSWEESYNPKKGEVSALQHYFNEWADKGEEFVMCEYQNEPMVDDAGGMIPLEPRDIIHKQVDLARLVVPANRSVLVAGIDVMDNELYYSVMAFGDGFSGTVVDYGAVQLTGRSPEQRIREGLIGEHGLLGLILYRGYKDENDREVPVSCILIDSGDDTELIYEICDRHNRNDIVRPSKGLPHNAFRMPKKVQASNKGEGWYYSYTVDSKTGRNTYLMHINVDHYKTLVDRRIRTPLGESGSWELYKRSNHRVYAEHLSSEMGAPSEDRLGNNYAKWQPRPGRGANHYWDTVIYCHAAASWRGIRLDGVMGVRPGKKLKLSEIQAARKRGKR
jgi:hypothetical protein